MNLGESTRRILCIEKDAAFLKTLKLGLECYGFEVLTASDSIGGWNHFQAHAGDFSVIFIDNEMSPMSGSTFARIIREGGFQGRLIVMSANLNARDLGDYWLHQVSGFFGRPFNVDAVAVLLMQPTQLKG